MRVGEPSTRTHLFILGLVVVALLAATGCAAAPITPVSGPATPTAAATTTVSVAPTATTATAVKTPVSSPSTPAATETIPGLLPLGDPEDVALWGREMTLDGIIQLCKSGQVRLIEWFMDDDRVRVTTMDGAHYNYRNTVTQVDIAKVLEENGVKVGANNGGIPFDYDA